VSAAIGWGVAIFTAWLVIAGGVAVGIGRALRGARLIQSVSIPDTAHEFLELTR
jgi:hypothetical protein